MSGKPSRRTDPRLVALTGSSSTTPRRVGGDALAIEMLSFVKMGASDTLRRCEVAATALRKVPQRWGSIVSAGTNEVLEQPRFHLGFAGTDWAAVVARKQVEDVLHS